MHDHGIYVENSVDAEITGNVFWDAPGWAIQLYPNAQRTLVAHNVIDATGGGILIGGKAGGGTYADGHASSGTTVEHNVITNTTAEYGVESYWGGSMGTDNVVRPNCMFNGAKGDLDRDGGRSPVGNLVADPCTSTPRTTITGWTRTARA